MTFSFSLSFPLSSCRHVAVNVCVVVGETRNKSSQRLEGRRLRPLIETQLEDVNDASDDDDIDHNEKKKRSITTKNDEWCECTYYIDCCSRQFDLDPATKTQREKKSMNKVPLSVAILPHLQVSQGSIGLYWTV